MQGVILQRTKPGGWCSWGLWATGLAVSLPITGQPPQGPPHGVSSGTALLCYTAAPPPPPPASVGRSVPLTPGCAPAGARPTRASRREVEAKEQLKAVRVTWEPRGSPIQGPAEKRESQASEREVNQTGDEDRGLLSS